MFSKDILYICIPLAVAGCMTMGPAKQHEVVRLQEDRPPLMEPEKPMPGNPALVSMVRTQVKAVPVVAAVEVSPSERFLAVYRQVGSPRILVYVNRNPEGKLIQSTFKTAPSPAGPAALSLDTGGIENKLAKAMGYDQQVAIVPREKVFEELTSGEVAQLQGGDVRVLAVLGEKLKAHVLIQAQPAMFEENSQGKLLLQAVNVEDGVVLAKSSVTIDDKGDYVQKAADEISRGLAATWTSPR